MVRWPAWKAVRLARGEVRFFRLPHRVRFEYLPRMGYSDPEAQRKYQREWKARRKAEWFAGKKCARCGSTKNLELDHIDPTKKVHHNVWSWSKQRREAELKKCQPLCEKCHAKKTVETRVVRTDHGRGQMYQRHGCRCEKCRAWKSASDKLYR